MYGDKYHNPFEIVYWNHLRISIVIIILSYEFEHTPIHSAQ